MTNISVQRNKMWLLKVENLTVVRECRRHIQKEFGVKLHLDADDLLESIQDYAGRSTDPTLRRLSRPIAHMLRGDFKNDSDQFGLAHIPVVTPLKSSPLGWHKSGN
jgi:hypothetical protein